MLYIKIGDNKYPADIETYTTQFGNTAIRIVGDVPTAENGFLIVDENDKVIGDRSDYIYLYREDDKGKDYLKVEEIPIPTESFYNGSEISPIDRKINSLNQKINALTPYTATQTGYYGESEKVFYGVPNGNVSVFFDGYSGDYSVSRIEDRLTVSFDSLDKETAITISVM